MRIFSLSHTIYIPPDTGLPHLSLTLFTCSDDSFIFIFHLVFPSAAAEDALPAPRSCAIGLGDGDCDHDDECNADEGLVCGDHNCATFRNSSGWPANSSAGWDHTDDCCMATCPSPYEQACCLALLGPAWPVCLSA